VDLKNLRFFTVVDDGGSPLTSPVDKQLVEAQKRVRSKPKQLLHSLHFTYTHIHNTSVTVLVNICRILIWALSEKMLFLFAGGCTFRSRSGSYS